MRYNKDNSSACHSGRSEKSTKRILISSARVIDPFNNIDKISDIIIENGIIKDAIPAQAGIQSDSSTINAASLIVTPGLIDLHVHLRDPGFMHKEDIESGAKAALAGGFTEIYCMPNTKPVNDNVETTKYILDKAKKVSKVIVHPVAAISKGQKGKELSDFGALKKLGVVAFSDDGMGVQSDDLMRRAMLKAKESGVLIISHAEDASRSNSRDAENSMIERDIKLAEETGARLHIAHVSTKEGVELVRNGKIRGVKVTCEVTPHHLTFFDAIPVYNVIPAKAGIPLNQRDPNFHGDDARIHPNFKMNPPLRIKEDIDALIEGINDGTVDAIATDHAPHAEYEKFPNNSVAAGLCAGHKTKSVRREIVEGRQIIPNGVIGMETAFSVCMKLAEEGKITIQKLVELFTLGPSRVISGTSLRGAKRRGNPANFTIFDPDEIYKIDSSKFKSKSKNTPFEGLTVKGRVKYVIIDSQVISV